MTAADAPSLDAASIQRLIESGNRLEDAGDIAAALRNYEEAVAASPGHLRAYLNLGNALHRLGRTEDAIAALERALRIDPSSAPVHFNLGNLRMVAGNLPAAEHALREAQRLDPSMTRAGIALANLLEMLRRPLEAEQELRHVLAGTPDCAPAAYNLGRLLQQRGEVDEAERLFRVCLDADPSFLMAATAMGDVIRNAGRSKDAEAWYRNALAADSHARDAWSGLLLSLNNRSDVSALEVFAEHLRFGAAFPEDDAMRAARKRHRRNRSRLRVGYLSGDFNQHPVALFLRPVLEHRNRAQVEVYCYSNNSRDDWMTGEIRSRADHWRNIAGSDDAAAAQSIRADELDILVDLSGHSARSRVLLFNHGCAPVQATWLGYLNTTGLRSADFRICDAFTDPIGMTEHLHTERLMRLPHSLWCYAPVYDIPRAAIPARDAPERVVFGSFNHVSKLSDRCLDLWCRVLHAVPGAVLRVYGVPPGSATLALLRWFEHRGVDRRRVSIHPGMNIDAYFDAIGGVDIALDSMPYNGGTTTLDTLWMEVPLVALAGDHPVSRSGVSILSTLQLPELVAATDDEYVAINLRLAEDRAWRGTLRDTLRARMLASPLMDGARFARDLENAFAQMLERP